VLTTARSPQERVALANTKQASTYLRNAKAEAKQVERGREIDASDPAQQARLRQEQRTRDLDLY
jgi:hypothetical protein